LRPLVDPLEEFIEVAIVRGRRLPREATDYSDSRFAHDRNLEVADEVDALHDFGREQRHHVEGGHVLSNLRGVRRAGDDGRHVGVRRAPRQRELGQRDVEFIGDDFDVGDFLVAPFVGEHAFSHS